MTSVEFPVVMPVDVASFAADYAAALQRALATLAPDRLAAAVDLIQRTIAADGTIFVCGNGGSAAIANHVTCDYTKILSLAMARPVRVVSLNAAAELNFAIANDIGFDEVFAFQLERYGRPGDLLWTVSSSGNSPNIVAAVRAAKRHGLRTLALTGFAGGASAAEADVTLHLACRNYGLVEDGHQLLTHVICQYLRARHTPPAEITSTVF